MEYRLPLKPNDSFEKTRKNINRVLDKAQELFLSLRENEEELTT